MFPSWCSFTCQDCSYTSACQGTTQANCYQQDTYRSAKTGTLYLHVLLQLECMYYQCSFISCQVVLVKFRVKTCIFLSYHNSYRHIVEYQLCYENKKTITLSDFLSFFIQDLQPEGRLQLVLKDLRARDQPDQSLPTSHQETQLKSFLKKYVGALTENIDA